MIWRKQGTSPNRLLCFSDLMFTCQGKLGEFIPASKIASAFLLALRREVNSIEFLVLFYTTFPKNFGEAKQNCQKNACISLSNYSTWRKQGTSPNQLLCFSDVMFTCQGKFGKFMPASKLASTFVLAFIKRVFMPLNRQ